MSLVITLKGISFTNPNLPIIPLDYPIDGIDALYRMDSVVNGTLQDSSGNNRHAIMDNNYSITKEGLRLDDGFAQTPISISQDDITIFCVHRIDKVPKEGSDSDRYRFVWSFYDGQTINQDQLYYTPTNSKWEFGQLKNKSSITDADQAEEEWIFTCMSWGGGRYKYICPKLGVSIDVATSSKPDKPSNIWFNIGQIGKQPVGSALQYSGFNGTIGVVGVYKKPKTMAQMQDIYKSAQVQMSKRGITL